MSPPTRRDLLAMAAGAPFAAAAWPDVEEAPVGESDVGSPFTRLQSRILGSFHRLHDFSDNATGQGVALYASANGTATSVFDGAAVFTDGTADEWAAAAVAPRAAAIGTGLVLAHIPWEVNQQFSNLDGAHEIGFISRDPVDGALNNSAVFRPDVGVNTTGNVEVTASGTTTQGQVDYSAIETDFVNDNKVITAIIIDYNADETHFYFQQNPYYDPPTETISATPDKVTPIGIHYFDSTDSAEGVEAAFAEVLYVF